MHGLEAQRLARSDELLLQLDHSLARAQPHLQLQRVARLHQIIVRARIESLDDVGLVVLGGEQHDVDVRFRWTTANSTANLDTVHLGHHPVDNRQSQRRIDCKGVQGGLTVAHGHHLVTPTREPMLEHGPSNRLVVGEQNLHPALRDCCGGRVTKAVLDGPYGGRTQPLNARQPIPRAPAERQLRTAQMPICVEKPWTWPGWSTGRWGTSVRGACSARSAPCSCFGPSSSPTGGSGCFRSPSASSDRALAHLRNARRLAEGFARLRGVFIKMGQVLSVVGTFLPSAFGEALETLQDQVPPRPFSEIEGRLREAFGDQPLARFGSFEREALAAASLAQVHRATTLDGRQIAVKILYP